MKTNRGNVLVYTLIILLLGAILMAVSNPNQERHLQVIKERLAGQNALASVVARTALAVNPPAYHSALVLSYTKYNNKLSSIGLFSYVWVDTKAFKNK